MVLTNILLRFLPLTVIILLLLIWFLSASKNNQGGNTRRMASLKVWVMTLAAVLALALVSIVVMFTSNDPVDSNKVEQPLHESENILNKIDPYNPPKDIP